MTVSVVIATYNRATLLGDCLARLACEPFAPGDEVVVVDNGSTDGTAAVVEAARGLFSISLHYLNEPSPGKSRAIARALEVASGDVLVFTDDDVTVDDGWLNAVRAMMRDPAIALVGGPVAPRWQAPPPRWLKQATDSYGVLAAPLALLDYGPSTVDIGERTVIGANMAIRKSVFVRVGGFAPHLGKLRGTLLSGEDREVCRRVQAAGFRAVYCPAARVRHFVPADRMRVGYYLSWFFWSGITHAMLDADGGVTHPTLFGVPRYLVRRAGTGVLGTMVSGLMGKRTAALECAIDVAFAAGYAWRTWTIRRRSPGVPQRGPQAVAAGGSGGGSQ